MERPRASDNECLAGRRTARHSKDYPSANAPWRSTEWKLKTCSVRNTSFLSDGEKMSREYKFKDWYVEGVHLFFQMIELIE